MYSRLRYQSDWSKTDRDALDALFVRARKEGLWFFYGGLNGPCWFSPDELQAQQDKGQFVWGAVNWKLCHPQELIDQLNEEIDDRQKEIVEVMRRMEKI